MRSSASQVDGTTTGTPLRLPSSHAHSVMARSTIFFSARSCTLLKSLPPPKAMVTPFGDTPDTVMLVTAAIPVSFLCSYASGGEKSDRDDDRRDARRGVPHAVLDERTGTGKKHVS